MKEGTEIGTRDSSSYGIVVSFGRDMPSKEPVLTGLSAPLPAITMLPSEAQLSDNPLAPSCTVSMHFLLLTSQNRTVPSVETDASSASFVGFHATLSIAPVWPRSSVLFFTCGFSGFHIRRVRSCEPVAIKWPVGFQAIVRILAGVMLVGMRPDGDMASGEL